MCDAFLSYLKSQGKSENTVKTYRRNISLYYGWCKDSFGKEPDRLYRSNVLDYISYMKNIKHYNPRSVNNFLSALHCLNAFLIENGTQTEEAVLKADFMKVQLQYASPCTVRKEDVEAFRQSLLEGGSKRDYAIVTLYAYTGIRQSECVRLSLKVDFQIYLDDAVNCVRKEEKMEDVDLTTREIRVVGKGDKYHLVYLNDLPVYYGKF